MSQNTTVFAGCYYFKPTTCFGPCSGPSSGHKLYSINCRFSIPLHVRMMEYFIGPSLHNNMVQCFYYATNN